MSLCLCVLIMYGYIHTISYQPLQVNMCVNIHQSVAETSKQFLAELSRHNYVTPTSYLELLGTFSRVLKLKNSEISNARQRTKTGLDKVLI